MINGKWKIRWDNWLFQWTVTKPDGKPWANYHSYQDALHTATANAYADPFEWIS
jgi:hypothetical protein